MSPLFQKLSRLEQRKLAVEKELSVLRKRRRALTRRVRRAGGSLPPEDISIDDWKGRPSSPDRFTVNVDRSRLSAESSTAAGPGKKAETAGSGSAAGLHKESVVDMPKEKGSSLRDARFVDYLSGNLETARSFRHERKTQRNRAIVMLVLVLAALFGLLYWLLF